MARDRVHGNVWRRALGGSMLALLALACSHNEDAPPVSAGGAGLDSEGASHPVAESGAPQDTFEDPSDLLEAIEEGTFAERAGTEELIEAARTVPDPVEIDFTSGTEVPADQAAKLEALAETLGKRDDIEVELIGCSDPSGPATVNLAISKDRAASVAAMLRELGVAEDQIGAVDGRGESCSPQTRTVHVTPALRNGPHRG